MTKKLTWRLAKLPTPDELSELIKTAIITKEEARNILFNEQEDRDKTSLQEEIKFLRELVVKLSQSTNQITTIIKEIEVPKYQKNLWYQPYYYWATGSMLDGGIITDANNIQFCSATGTDGSSFNTINTF